jgi:hypothetical protein
MKMFKLFRRKESPPKYDQISIRSAPPTYDDTYVDTYDKLPKYEESHSKKSNEFLDIIRTINKENTFVILDKSIVPMDALKFLMDNEHSNINLYSVNIKDGKECNIIINGNKMNLDTNTYFYGLSDITISVDDYKFDWSSKCVNNKLVLTSIYVYTRHKIFGISRNSASNISSYTKTHKGLNFLEYCAKC